jgi:hypothetical protein
MGAWDVDVISERGPAERTAADWAKDEAEDEDDTATPAAPPSQTRKSRRVGAEAMGAVYRETALPARIPAREHAHVIFDTRLTPYELESVAD